MKDTNIKFKWIENKQEPEHVTELERKKIFAIFEGLRQGYEGKNNEISSRLVEIIPIVDEICLNKYHNETQDIPFLIYKINGEVRIIKIGRIHHIIWSIIESFCSE